MKPVEMSKDYKPYSIRLMMQDAFIVLAPILLMFIGLLWVYRRQWSLAGLEQVLAAVLPF